MISKKYSFVIDQLSSVVKESISLVLINIYIYKFRFERKLLGHEPSMLPITLFVFYDVKLRAAYESCPCNVFHG